MPDTSIIKSQKTSGFSYWIKHHIQYLPPVYSTLLLFIAQINFGILDSYLSIFACVGTSIITELLLSKLLYGVWRKNLASAYMTAISVCILIRATHLMPYILTTLLSMMSKYVITYKNKHIFNPSAFGVSWMLFVAPASVAALSTQWGSNFLALSVIWLLGVYVVLRAKRLHVSVAYVISFIILAYFRSLYSGDSFISEIAPLTGAMYQLFIFLMITDPVTSVSTKKGRILVAVLIAVVESILRMNGFIYAPFYSIFIVGPITKYIDLKRNHIRLKLALQATSGK